MNRFIRRLSLFALPPVVLALGWTAFVIWADHSSYTRALVAPDGVTVAVCGDSQTKDGLDPERFQELFNFSTAATTCDQDLLRLGDLLDANPGRFGHVILDASILKLGYDISKPMSELNAGRVHTLLYLYHAREARRPCGSLTSLWRDVICVRKFNEFRKALLRGKPWRSSMAGEFSPGRTRGFLNPRYRDRALGDVRTKAARVNELAPAETNAAFFACLAEAAARVRAAGAKPVFSSMPLSPALREAIDPERRQAFRAAMRAFAAAEGAPYLDFLEEELPEECWYDANHLNEEGAARFTPTFAARFRSAGK